jgi:hypothetical protein
LKPVRYRRLRSFYFVALVAIVFCASCPALAAEVAAVPAVPPVPPAPGVAESSTKAVPLKSDPKWETPLTSGNDVLPKLIQAISGRENSDETKALLRGVVKISRTDDSFSLIREDSRELRFGPDTILGDKMVQNLERTKHDTDKYGQNLGKVVSGLKGVSVAGNRVELLREGPDQVVIPVSAGSKKIPFKLKEVKLSRLTMDLDESKGFPAVRNISGLEVVVTAGMDFHIVLKEFWRTRNNRGDTTVTFGILNPIPRAIRCALGLKEISYFSHTVRKKQERSA